MRGQGAYQGHRDTVAIRGCEAGYAYRYSFASAGGCTAVRQILESLCHNAAHTLLLGPEYQCIAASAMHAVTLEQDGDTEYGSGP